MLGTSEFRDCGAMDTNDVSRPLRYRKVLKLSCKEDQSAGLNDSLIRDRLILVDEPQSACVSIRLSVLCAVGISGINNDGVEVVCFICFIVSNAKTLAEL